jgi:hypothetical protein
LIVDSDDEVEGREGGRKKQKRENERARERGKEKVERGFCARGRAGTIDGGGGVMGVMA